GKKCLVRPHRAKLEEAHRAPAESESFPAAPSTQKHLETESSRILPVCLTWMEEKRCRSCGNGTLVNMKV
ncbi:hypothetical protein DYE48_20170, partial [Halobacillus trueperi]